MTKVTELKTMSEFLPQRLDFRNGEEGIGALLFSRHEMQFHPAVRFGKDMQVEIIFTLSYFRDRKRHF